MLATAPFTDAENSQFFRPIVNGRIAFSARLFETGIFPSSRKRHRYIFSFFAYCTADESADFDAGAIVSSHAKKSSRTGLVFS